MSDRRVLKRRSILRAGGLGLMGLSMPKLMRAAEATKSIKPRAKSVIFLFQWGGPKSA
ncbi:MAG: hypothetical protein R3C05_30000 [Pirellulaceae bacterium]